MYIKKKKKKSLSYIQSTIYASKRRNVTKLCYPREIVQRLRNEGKISMTGHQADSHSREGAIATSMQRFSRHSARRLRSFPVFFGERRDGTECLAVTPFGGLPPPAMGLWPIAPALRSCARMTTLMSLFLPCRGWDCFLFVQWPAFFHRVRIASGVPRHSEARGLPLSSRH